MGATVRDVSTPQDFTTLAQQQNVNTGFKVDKRVLMCWSETQNTHKATKTVNQSYNYG